MYRWNCTCECGQVRSVPSTSLISGNSKSCGCGRILAITTHGQTKTALYRLWHGIVERCENRRAHHYKDYGGRGIKICRRWRVSFMAFKGDMGPRPSLKHSVDRIRNNGNYTPDNCRWATKLVQANNTRGNRFITFNGETLTLTQWSRRFGINPITLHGRLKFNWPLSEAFSKPAKKRTASPTIQSIRGIFGDARRRAVISAVERNSCLTDAAIELGLSIEMLRRLRKRYGMRFTRYRR